MQTNRGSVSASKLHMCWKARQVGRASRAAASGGGGGGGGKLGWGRKAAPRDPKDSDQRRSKIAPAPAAKSGGVGGWGQEQGLHLRLWPKLIQLTGASPCGLSVCKYGGALADPHKPSAGALATAPALWQATSAVGCGLLPWGGL